MRVAVSGSTGLIGSNLVAKLRADGHSVSRLVRDGPSRSDAERLIHWNPARGSIDAAALEKHDVVVHLAGEPLFGLWTRARKQAIRESRVRGTALLARTIHGLKNPPAVFTTASAIGYYGDRPNETVDENSAAGRGFLAEVVQAWEDAAQPARSVSRVAHTRFGLILTPKGGSLQAMLPLFKLGMGGRLGSGEQIWSWVTIHDVLSAISHVATTDLSGPVNVTAPNAVSNEQFTRILGKVLSRPTVLPAPAFALRLLMQEMADELLLSGARVMPRRLMESGFVFQHPDLEPALRAILYKP